VKRFIPSVSGLPESTLPPVQAFRAELETPIGFTQKRIGPTRSGVGCGRKVADFAHQGKWVDAHDPEIDF
jgi:hypothetical protein